MKQVLICAMLLGAASSAWATEYGNVISVNPVIQRSTTMQPSCTNPNGTSVAGCETAAGPQAQVIGYQIQYMYKGQTYSAQIPNDPGKTVPLRFDQDTGNPIPAVAYQMPPTSVTMPTTVVVAQPPPYYYGAPYYDPAYYGPAYYGPGFYGPAVVGVGIGIGFHGGWGGGWGHRR